jgi:transposase-like protein
MKYKIIYFNPDLQKVRYTESKTIDESVNYNYIGESTRVEFDLLIELLWHKYEDSEISLEDFKKIFEELRKFCDSIKYQLNL